MLGLIHQKLSLSRLPSTWNVKLLCNRRSYLKKPLWESMFLSWVWGVMPQGWSSCQRSTLPRLRAFAVFVGHNFRRAKVFKNSDCFNCASKSSGVCFPRRSSIVKRTSWIDQLWSSPANVSCYLFWRTLLLLKPWSLGWQWATRAHWASWVQR